MLNREWRCSWSSADRQCSNYIWVINKFIACLGVSYIRYLTVYVKYFLKRKCIWKSPWQNLVHLVQALMCWKSGTDQVKYSSNVFRFFFSTKYSPQFVHHRIMSMVLCKTELTLLLMHWSYHSVARSHVFIKYLYDVCPILIFQANSFSFVTQLSIFFNNHSSVICRISAQSQRCRIHLPEQFLFVRHAIIILSNNHSSVIWSVLVVHHPCICRSCRTTCHLVAAQCSGQAVRYPLCTCAIIAVDCVVRRSVKLWQSTRSVSPVLQAELTSIRKINPIHMYKSFNKYCELI